MNATPNQSVDSTRAAGAAASRRPRVLGQPEGIEGGDRAALAPVPTAGVVAASIGAADGGPDAFDRSPRPSGTAAAERLRAAYEAEEGWRRFAGRDGRPAGAIRPADGAPGAGGAVFLGESQRGAFAAIGRALADRRVCVALTGPAGAGKTALLEAVLAATPGVASRVFRIETPAAVDEAQAERILRVGLGSRRGPERGTARPAREAPPPPGAAGEGAERRAPTVPAEGETPGASSVAAPMGGGDSRGDAPGASRSGRGPDGDGRAPVGKALFVVDDAHEASPLLLRCLARVAADRRDGRRSAQLLLVGRPELWDRLRHDAFVPLARRLVLRLDLKPWTEDDARDYIAHLLARPRRVEGQVLAPDAEQEVLHRARARPDRIGALVGAALSHVDLRTRSPITRDDVLAVDRARGDTGRTEDARSDGIRTDGIRTGPRMDRDDASRDARPGGVRPPPPPRLAAFARPPFGARGTAVAAAVVLAVAGAAVAGVSLFRRAPPPQTASAPGQAVLAPTPDGSADRRTAEGAPASPPADRGGPPRDPVAPASPRRADEIGASGGTATNDGAVSIAALSPPPRSTPSGGLEDAGAPGGPGEPSPAPTGGDPAPRDERTAAVGPPDAPPGPERQSAPDGEGGARVEGAAPAGASETSQTPAQPPAVRPRDPAEAPSPPLSPTVLAALMRRGDEMLAGGDPAGARRFYERAAASGSAPGMRGMARTFDPAVIGRDGEADPATAAAWYARAAALGDATAAARLKQIERTR